jgi:hypothetical protein
MPATTRNYRISSLFSSLVLKVEKKSCAVFKNGHTYDVDRSEAANMIRYARSKGYAQISK